MEPMVPMRETYSSRSTNLILTRSHVFSGTSMEAEAVLAEPTANQEKVELEVMVEMEAHGMLTDDYYLHLSIRNIIDDEIGKIGMVIVLIPSHEAPALQVPKDLPVYLQRLIYQGDKVESKDHLKFGLSKVI